jgi:hypothetical protein
MTSTIDAMLALRDRRDWVERLGGARFAQAGNLSSERDPRESEAAFLHRVRAAAAGHHTVDVRGVIMLPVVTTTMAGRSGSRSTRMRHCRRNLIERVPRIGLA